MERIVSQLVWDALFGRFLTTDNSKSKKIGYTLKFLDQKDRDMLKHCTSRDFDCREDEIKKLPL